MSHQHFCHVAGHYWQCEDMALREQAAAFIKDEVRRANDPSPGFRQDGRKPKEGHPPVSGVRLLLLVEGAADRHVRNRGPRKRSGA